MSFRDFLNVAACPHPRWADDGPNVFGERVCAVCEQRVVVVLTEAGFKTAMNSLATREGFRRPFLDID